MALTETRWIGIVAIVCLMATAGSLARNRPDTREPLPPADSLRLVDLQRQVSRASLRWEALARRDSVVAHLPPSGAADIRAPLLAIDPRLPVTHRSMIERAVRRQWTSLHIDSARIPVAIALVIDTGASHRGLGSERGQIAFDYLAPTASIGDGARCTVIATVQSRHLVRPGTQRAFSELVATPASASALLGPCAFLARFGAPGEEIDRWLRLRSYDLAAHPQWWSLPEGEVDDIAARWTRANAGSRRELPTMMFSPEALGCAAGNRVRCAETLGAREGGDTTSPGGLIIMGPGRDPHWRSLSSHYLADLVTTLGPERFERFWQSELTPDAALRSAAGVSLNEWTQTWAAGLLSEPRFGPDVSLRDIVVALTLAGLSLALAAWGWGRRQVR